MAEPITTPQAGGEPAPAANPAPEKTFTQAEVDAIVGKRLTKAMKGMPDETELADYRKWKESQQTEAQRMTELTKERDTAKTDLAAALAKVEQYEHEKLLLSKGVSAEDVDYYAFKASQLVSDTKTFEQAADEIIKARQPKKVVVDFGAPLQGTPAPKTTNDAMNALIRGARK